MLYQIKVSINLNKVYYFKPKTILLLADWNYIMK
jgi:hypothetical protein